MWQKIVTKFNFVKLNFCKNKNSVIFLFFLFFCNKVWNILWKDLVATDIYELNDMWNGFVRSECFIDALVQRIWQKCVNLLLSRRLLWMMGGWEWLRVIFHSHVWAVSTAAVEREGLALSFGAGLSHGRLLFSMLTDGRRRRRRYCIGGANKFWRRNYGSIL